MKKSMVIAMVLCISLALNLYLGINSYIKSTYTPNVDDLEILGEMTRMVLEHEQYKEIDSQETIYAITPGVSRFNVASPSSIFNYEVYVKTDQQTYIFTCVDDRCTDVINGGWTYSRYSEEEPLLPMKKGN